MEQPCVGVSFLRRLDFIESGCFAHELQQRYNPPGEEVGRMTIWSRLRTKLRGDIFSRARFSEYDETIAECSEAIRVAPQDSIAYVKRGRAWGEKGEYDKAIADFNEAIRLDPQDVKAYCSRGRAWVSKGQFDTAIADFNEAIRLDPQYADAYIGRGINWHQKGEYDKAIADFNEAIRLDPQGPKAYYNRGRAWTETREYDKAITDHTEAIRLAPPHAKVKRSTVSSQQINLMNIQSRARYSRSLAWAGKGEYDKAIADCTEAIRLDPRFADAYIGRGSNWDSKGEYDKAITDFNKALRIAPQSADAYHSRGDTWVRKGEYDKAIADYSEAIRLDPLDPRSYNNRGIALKRARDYQGAVADYTEAIRLGPDTARRYATLAWLLATCSDGRYRNGAKAVQLAEKACEITDCWNADSAHVLAYVLAAAHAENGNFSDAVSWQRKAVGSAAPNEKADMLAGLRLYEAGKPYHEE
ncbi:MAG TPA: tetratricopeptide repeat protein [Pirellulales bacterium]|nr:tetratricopeptide repeat protein [Pirellulales bacterium]